jgi:hypothetical protein
MSERIYALLLRLFPSHFRKAYGEEALQLFRDRTRDEKGFFPRLQLWFDLFADLAISVPREYFYAEPELIAVSGQRLGGTPWFYIVGEQSPRPGALFLGAMLSLPWRIPPGTKGLSPPAATCHRSSVVRVHTSGTACRPR